MLAAHRRPIAVAVALTLVVTACGRAKPAAAPAPSQISASVTASPSPSARTEVLPGMPPPLRDDDVYAAAGPNMLSDTVKGHRELVYVPHTLSNDVYVIDPKTFKVVDRFPGGREAQHIIPSYDMKTLYVAADEPCCGSLIPIDPTTGKPGKPLNVADPYNMYFTPDGRYGVVMAEYFQRMDFYDPVTWTVVDQLHLPDCRGVNHGDFTADGKLMLVACEFANRVVVIDVATRKWLRTFKLDKSSVGMPQDTRLTPDGKSFYVADMHANGVYVFDSALTRQTAFIPTGRGAHGIYFSRDSKRAFVTNRDEGSVTVMDPRTNQVITKWQIPGGGSPDMGALSPDGSQLWLSGRYHGEVYVISTVDGTLLARIPVGSGPHGLTYWPQPGRYSLGHTGNIR
jgi:YVTN family beta-propeller protein